MSLPTAADTTTLLLQSSFQPCNLLLELSQQRVLGILVDLRLVLYVLRTVSVPVNMSSQWSCGPDLAHFEDCSKYFLLHGKEQESYVPNLVKMLHK